MFNRDDEVFEDHPVRVARFHPVESEGALDAFFARADSGETALLLLHDPFCPVSSYAYEQVEQVDADVHLIDVSQRSVFGRIVQLRTGIRHESPQAIIFRDGSPAWHASHGRIRAGDLRNALTAG
jgi:bacillithiol system protein YtxJ